MDIELTLAEYITPFITALVALIFSLWIRDLGTKVVKGLAFKFSSNFNAGDKVILDGEEAIIVKIGLDMTVFGIHRKSEDDDCYRYYWRYVANERIPFLHIEKVIRE